MHVLKLIEMKLKIVRYVGRIFSYTSIERYTAPMTMWYIDLLYLIATSREHSTNEY